MRRFFAALSIFIALGLTTSLAAKGLTTKITISGSSLPAPINITDEAVLRKFQVWAGPGVTTGRDGREVEETEGFIIDWASGIVQKRPIRLPHFEVAFYVGSSNQPVYVVLYELDLDAEQGYVYLPGPADQLFSLNSRAMFHGHGFEGHWLHASSAWQKDVIVPLMQRAAR